VTALWSPRERRAYVPYHSLVTIRRHEERAVRKAERPNDVNLIRERVKQFYRTRLFSVNLEEKLKFPNGTNGSHFQSTMSMKVRGNVQGTLRNRACREVPTASTLGTVHIVG
jgi:hypothetical protein